MNRKLFAGAFLLLIPVSVWFLAMAIAEGWLFALLVLVGVLAVVGVATLAALLIASGLDDRRK